MKCDLLACTSKDYLQASGLVAIVVESDKPDVQAAVVTRLLSQPSSPLFDSITHTKTLTSMMHHVSAAQVTALAGGL